MASGHMNEHAIYSLYRIFIEMVKFVFFIEMLNFESQLLLRSSLVMTAGNYNNNLIIIIIPIVTDVTLFFSVRCYTNSTPKGRVVASGLGSIG